MSAVIEDPSRAIALVAPFCDIVDRLKSVSPSASIRGVWFRVFLNELADRGLMAKYEEYFPGETWSPLKFYWVGDYLPRIALAGAIVASPEKVLDGMFELNRSNARRFAGSLLGKTLFRLLSNDPQRLLEQGIASRRQTMDYGRWSIAFPTADRVEIRLEQEYIWSDPNVLASFIGTFEAIGRGVDATVSSTSKFDSVIHLKLS